MGSVLVWYNRIECGSLVGVSGTSTKGPVYSQSGKQTFGIPGPISMGGDSNLFFQAEIILNCVFIVFNK
jgi:hypothetical protein